MNDFKLLNRVNIHEETGYRGHGRHPLFRQSIGLYHKKKISVFVSPFFLYFACDVRVRIDPPHPTNPLQERTTYGKHP